MEAPRFLMPVSLPELESREKFMDSPPRGQRLTSFWTTIWSEEICKARIRESEYWIRLEKALMQFSDAPKSLQHLRIGRIRCCHQTERYRGWQIQALFLSDMTWPRQQMGPKRLVREKGQSCIR